MRPSSAPRTSPPGTSAASCQTCRYVCGEGGRAQADQELGQRRATGVKPVSLLDGGASQLVTWLLTTALAVSRCSSARTATPSPWPLPTSPLTSPRLQVSPLYRAVTMSVEVSRERIPLAAAYKAAGQRAVLRVNNGLERHCAGESVRQRGGGVGVDLG